MARTEKANIRYFSHDADCNSDPKIKFIRAKHGNIGKFIFFELLEVIYNDKGYYLELSEKFKILFSSDNKIELKDLNIMIEDFLEEGLFFKLFSNKYNILTSKRIQMNYLDATKRKNNIELIKEYLLLDGVDINRENVNIIKINGNKVKKKVNINSQSKDKVKTNKSESKVELVTHTFEDFKNYFIDESDYLKYKDYDLSFYFDRVKNTYPDKSFDLKKMKSQIIFFIENDIKSDKFEPKKNPKEKTDFVGTAYKYVKENMDFINQLENKEPIEVTAELMKNYKGLEKNNPLFEGYIEMAYKNLMLKAV